MALRTSVGVDEDAAGGASEEVFPALIHSTIFFRLKEDYFLRLVLATRRDPPMILRVIPTGVPQTIS